MIADVKLPFRERFRMAWELTWPLALMDLSVVSLIHGMLDVSGETLDSLWAVAAFFVASPWVVRRALSLPYGSLRVQPRLTYQQSLKVMWLLAWRTLVLSLIALLVISGALRLFGVTGRDLPNPGPFLNALGLSAVDTVSSLVFYPLLIPGMFRKRFRGFHLELQEPAPQHAVTARKTRSR